MIGYDTTTGRAFKVTAKTPGKCTQQLEGDHYFVRQTAGVPEVIREHWRNGKVTEEQRYTCETMQEAEQLARKLQES